MSCTSSKFVRQARPTTRCLKLILPRMQRSSYYREFCRKRLAPVQKWNKIDISNTQLARNNPSKLSNVDAGLMSPLIIGNIKIGIDNKTEDVQSLQSSTSPVLLFQMY